jgi:hypothetical protein
MHSPQRILCVFNLDVPLACRASEIQPEVTEYDNESEDEYYDPNDPNAAPWVEVRQRVLFAHVFAHGQSLFPLSCELIVPLPPRLTPRQIGGPRQEQFYYYNYMSGDTEWDFPDGENVYTWSTFK